MKTKMPVWGKALGITFVVAAAAVGVSKLRGGEVSPSLVPAASADGKAPAAQVQTVKPEYRDVARVIRLPGDVMPLQEATIYAKVAGYLDRITVDKGDHVQSGQLLAVIRAPELEADRDQARESYRSAVESAQVGIASTHKANAEEKRSEATVARSQADYAQAPAAVAKAKAQLDGARSAESRAEEQQRQAEGALEDAHAQVDRAAADLEAAKAEQQLADLTLARYQGIYKADSKLIARQDVDIAESKAKTAQSRAAAARIQLDSAHIRVRTAESQVRASQQAVAEARSGVTAYEQAVKMAEAQRVSSAKQVEIARKDLDVSRIQQGVATAQARQAGFSAQAQNSASARSTALADYTQIRAPFAGIVTKRNVDKGAFVQTAAATQSAQPIATIADMSTVRVYIHVPELEAQFVRAGTPVQVAWGGPKTPAIRGMVSRTSGSLDPKTRTLLAEVDLSNKSGALLPGAYVMVKVSLEKHANTLSLPKEAVGAEKQNRFVFIAEKGKAKRVPVIVGFEDGKYTEVTEGLHGGEEVIVTGRDSLTPGAEVKTSPWTPPTDK